MKYLEKIFFLCLIPFGFTITSQSNTRIIFEDKTFYQDTTNTKDTSSCVVYVSFIVEKDGSITNVRVDSVQCDKSRRQVSKLKKEAIRLDKSMPKFKPSKIDSELVRAKFTLPIKFKE